MHMLIESDGIYQVVVVKVLRTGFENPAIAADAVRAHALAPARTLALDDFFHMGLIFSLSFRAFIHVCTARLYFMHHH